MKKAVFFLIFTLFSISSFALKVNIGASVETARYGVTSNTLDLVGGSGTTYSYVQPIYAINAEVVQEFDFGEIGAGATYEQGYERQDGETFNAIPIYGIVKLKLNPLFLNAKYGTTMYVDVSDPNTKYTDAQYLSIGLGIEMENNMSLQGTVNANTVNRNGVEMGSVSYGFAVSYNTF